MSEKVDHYAAWKRELGGGKRDLPQGVACAGFWSLKAAGGRTPIATWVDEDEDMVAKVGDKDAIIVDPEFCERIFSKVRAEHEADYRAAMEGKPWPDEVKAPARRVKGANPQAVDAITLAADTAHLDQRNAVSEDVIILGQIEDLETEAKAWLKQIGGKITNETEATKAAAYKDRFQKLFAEAERNRVDEKEPHLTAGREVDERWGKVKKRGNDLKLWAEGLPQDWLREEQRKRTEAARLAAEAARAAADPAEAIAAPVVVEPVRVKVGAGRGISTPANKPKLVVDDWNVLATHMATLAIFVEEPAVRSVMFRLAEQRLAAGVDVPGAHLDKAPAV
jgi:hypothetical protein